MKKKTKKLVLAKETVKNLEAASLSDVAAGETLSFLYHTCNAHSFCECPATW